MLDQRGPHSGKLNHLALEICHVAENDDLIMFLDGDAFPVADPMPVILDGLERAPLVAVRRAENVNDPQPHPCFCVTTVGTWRTLPGDWSQGWVWPPVNGTRVSDVGANLLRTLELTETQWVQLLRTNGSGLHPLFFAIYGDIVYHHGAGFRDGALPRVDRHSLKAGAAEQRTHHPARRLMRAGIQRIRGGSEWNEAIERNDEQSRAIFDAIQADGSDWLARVKGEIVAEVGS